MKTLDLFCGAAGGMTLGLERAGFHTVAACEIDPWRRAVYSRNFPHVKMFGDIKELKGKDVGKIDCIAGSPPCQDASSANSKGKGIDGERTGLFWEAVRLVREMRPRWVLLENVPGLRTRGYDRIHDALEAENYSIWPLVVGAWHAGAPHRRNRVWIVANANAGGIRQPVLPRGTVAEATEPQERNRWASTHSPLDGRRPWGQGRFDPGGEGQQQPALHDVADVGQSIAAERCEDGGWRGWSEVLAQWEGWNGRAPDLGRVDDGLPKGVARAALAAYGDSVVPQIAEAIGRAIMRADTLE